MKPLKKIDDILKAGRLHKVIKIALGGKKKNVIFDNLQLHRPRVEMFLPSENPGHLFNKCFQMAIIDIPGTGMKCYVH